MNAKTSEETSLSHFDSSNSRSVNEISTDSTKQSESDSHLSNLNVVTNLGLTQIPMIGGNIDLKNAKIISRTSYSFIYSLEIAYSPEQSSSTTKNLLRNNQVRFTLSQRHYQDNN